MLEQLEVPEVNVDEFFNGIEHLIKKRGIKDEEVLSLIKNIWTYINKLQVSCLRMQRDTINCLTEELNELKDKK